MKRLTLSRRNIGLFTIVLLCFFTGGVLYWMFEKPQYVELSIPVQGEWWHVEYTIRKFSSGSDYFMVRQKTRIYGDACRESEFSNLESVSAYFEEELKNLGWRKTEEKGTVERCSKILPESTFQMGTGNTYLSHYISQDAIQTYETTQVCLAILPAPGTCMEAYDVVIVTGNPHWLDVIRFEFTHPRSGQ